MNNHPGSDIPYSEQCLTTTCSLLLELQLHKEKFFFSSRLYVHIAPFYNIMMAGRHTKAIKNIFWIVLQQVMMLPSMINVSNLPEEPYTSKVNLKKKTGIICNKQAMLIQNKRIVNGKM